MNKHSERDTAGFPIIQRSSSICAQETHANEVSCVFTCVSVNPLFLPSVTHAGAVGHSIGGLVHGGRAGSEGMVSRNHRMSRHPSLTSPISSCLLLLTGTAGHSLGGPA